ncbi:hypothetical protein Q3G72_009113 [Acer saccharum]|nr:hypothetical protein Q3G72_009113 [Acer saccharum]
MKRGRLANFLDETRTRRFLHRPHCPVDCFWLQSRHPTAPPNHSPLSLRLLPATSIAGMANVVKVVKDHQIPKPQGQDKIGRFLSNFTKFTVDSAVNVSFKGVNGGKKVYQFVEERLKNQPPLFCLNAEKKLEPVEEMQAKMEEMHEGMNILKQQNNTSVKLAEDSQIQKKKIPNEEGYKGSDLPETNQKRVFIRSRL